MLKHDPATSPSPSLEMVANRKEMWISPIKHVSSTLGTLALKTAYSVVGLHDTAVSVSSLAPGF